MTGVEMREGLAVGELVVVNKAIMDQFIVRCKQLEFENLELRKVLLDLRHPAAKKGFFSEHVAAEQEEEITDKDDTYGDPEYWMAQASKFEADSTKLRTALEEAHKVADSNIGTGHGLVKIRTICRIALSSEEAAFEPKGDPIRKALENAVPALAVFASICNLREPLGDEIVPDCRFFMREYRKAQTALTAAREALQTNLSHSQESV